MTTSSAVGELGGRERGREGGREVGKREKIIREGTDGGKDNA